MFWIIGGPGIFYALENLVDAPILRLIVRQFDHSSWNGFTFWDFIFPLFLFIVGIAMPFSFVSRIERGDSPKTLYLHVVKRTITLFFLGLICNGGFGRPISELRVLGVLQRIALCYFFASIVTLNMGIREQGIVAVSLLVLYWTLMKLVPVPGHGAGVLTPEGNLAGYIDRRFLPGPFCCYEWGDNEGILSTMPAISTVLFGVLTGHWLRSAKNSTEKTTGLVWAGISGVVSGLLANVWFPINKLISTSSYILLSAGLSWLLLSIFYWLIDKCGYRKWAFPFIVIGMNPITIYMLNVLVDFHSITVRLIGGDLANLFGSATPLLYVVCELSVKWLLLFWMYQRKIFIKI